VTDIVVTLGEVHTGMLHHSRAVSATTAARLLDIVLGERVRRSDRPIGYAVSPNQLTGVDCLLPTSSGAKVRGVGTAVSRAAITGGLVVQGSAYFRATRSRQERRLPWSHYLAQPGIVETIGKADGKHLADGFLARRSPSEQLDLGAISTRAMDAIQDQRELDRRAAFRFVRTRFRWAVCADGAPAGAPELLKTIGPELLEGLLFSVADWPMKGQEDFIARFKKRTGEPWLTQDSLSAYGDMWIFKEAIERAGAADKLKVAEAIRGLNLTEGPAAASFPGPIKFDDKGRRVDVPMIFAQWQNGEPVTVYPADRAIAKPFWPSV